MREHELFVMGDLCSNGKFNNLMRYQGSKFVHQAASRFGDVYTSGEIWMVTSVHLRYLERNYFGHIRPQWQVVFYSHDGIVVERRKVLSFDTGGPHASFRQTESLVHRLPSRGH